MDTQLKLESNSFKTSSKLEWIPLNSDTSPITTRSCSKMETPSLEISWIRSLRMCKRAQLLLLLIRFSETKYLKSMILRLLLLTIWYFMIGMRLDILFNIQHKRVFTTVKSSSKEKLMDFNSNLTSALQTSSRCGMKFQTPFMTSVTIKPSLHKECPLTCLLLRNQQRQGLLTVKTLLICLKNSNLMLLSL